MLINKKHFRLKHKVFPIIYIIPKLSDVPKIQINQN